MATIGVPAFSCIVLKNGLNRDPSRYIPPVRKKLTRGETKVEKKIYLTLTMVEGDNAQYNQHRMRQIWDDAGRGAVPLNWSISAFLYDMGPAIFAYYQSTATANEPSGRLMRVAATAPAIAITAPTERSTPPVAITTVMPSDNSMTVEPFLRMSISEPDK